ncbi:MAG TPA: PIN domain nuclease [Terracidiphilus sp.]|jgi:predicted nucleic acid-binding protein|nr:PIN domain nuclease [Terracidiphilus sp.]
MVIVDSSVWIDYLNDKANSQTAWLESEIGQREIGLTSLILCEVLQGIRHNRQFRETREQLATLPVFESLRVELATAAAQNFRFLQQRGFTIRKTIDCILATFCIQEGHQLLHRDSDFEPFEKHLGMRVVHPPAIAQH